MLSRIFVFLFISIINFSLSPQDFNMSPPDSELINTQETSYQDGLKTTWYKYRSKSSQEEIVAFYRRLFTNEGYQEKSIPKGKSPVYVFVKEKEGGIVMLNFLSQEDKSNNIYFITVQDIDPEAKYFKDCCSEY